MSVYDLKEKTGGSYHGPPRVKIAGKLIEESTRCQTEGCGHSLAKHYEDRPHACSVAPFCRCRRFKRPK